MVRCAWRRVNRAAWYNRSRVDVNAQTVGGAGAPAPQGFSLLPQQIFGPYRIIRSLGKGGMGEVYEAQELGTERRVALKILTRALVDRDASDRFLREGVWPRR